MSRRLVLDTNQFVSGLIRPQGLQAQLLRRWKEGEISLIVSERLVAEIVRVLRRPYFREKHRITDEKIQALIELLCRYAEWVPGETRIDAIPDDPSDNKVLACAVEGEADYIVSGDRHLLKLRSYQGIPILRAAQLWERLAEART